MYTHMYVYSYFYIFFDWRCLPDMKNYNFFKRIIIVFCIMIMFAVSVTESITYASIRTPRLNIRTLSLVKGKSYKLRLYNTSSNHTISFESEDPEIASLRNVRKNSCSIKAKSSGQTTVTAYITDNTTEEVTELNCKVTVTPPAVTVKFCKKKLKLQLGMSKKAKISIKPATSLELPRFFSDDPEIASVSSNGTVTANKVGKTTIRVSIGNGKAALCKIVVKDNKNNEDSDDNSKDDNTDDDYTTGSNDKDTQNQVQPPKPTPTQEPGISSPNSLKPYPQYDDNRYYNYNPVKQKNDTLHYR